MLQQNALDFAKFSLVHGKDKKKIHMILQIILARSNLFYYDSLSPVTRFTNPKHYHYHYY